MSIQREDDTEQYPEYQMPWKAPGMATGGNKVIINQDEDDVAVAIYENPEVEAARGMWVENDSYCQGVYKRADFAGS